MKKSKKTRKKTMYEKCFKRELDIFCSLVGLIVLWPLLLVLSLLIKIKLGSPVIFKQERPGLNEKIFTLYKFRTMTDETDEQEKLLSDEDRLTKFGKWLRSTSFDELPELWNILKGDMSVVGPRPQLVRDMVFMNAIQRQRHYARSGLTGKAQVNGRNSISWEEKIKYDLDYIENISFRVDFRIIQQTICCVFKREGIHAEDMDTAEDLGDYLLRQKLVTLEAYVNKQKLAERLIDERVRI